MTDLLNTSIIFYDSFGAQLEVCTVAILKLKEPSLEKKSLRINSANQSNIT